MVKLTFKTAAGLLALPLTLTGCFEAATIGEYVGTENLTPGWCSDEADNDGDGLVDCDDSDCFEHSDCDGDDTGTDDTSSDDTGAMDTGSTDTGETMDSGSSDDGGSDSGSGDDGGEDSGSSDTRTDGGDTGETETETGAFDCGDFGDAPENQLSWIPGHEGPLTLWGSVDGDTFTADDYVAAGDGSYIATTIDTGDGDVVKMQGGVDTNGDGEGDVWMAGYNSSGECIVTGTVCYGTTDITADTVPESWGAGCDNWWTVSDS